MKYIFDTNTCIAFMKKNPRLIKSIRTKKSQGFYISSITEAELWFGILNSRLREKNSELLQSLLNKFSKLPFQSEDALFFGEMKLELKSAGKMISDNDILIASQAKRHDLILVTDDESDFKRFRDLRIENWLRD